MIKIKFAGYLGNQMFQYAVCRTLAEKYNYKFYIESGADGSLFRDIFPKLSFGEDIGNISNHITEGPGYFKPEILDIRDNTELYGFFQSEKYFDYNEANIKEWFKIELNESDNAIYESVISKYPYDKFCYIHFRGGQYPPSWKQNRSYYDYAKSKILEIDNNIKFVVITNDVNDAHNYFDEEDVIITNHNLGISNIDSVISNNYKIDFKLLCFSDYLITTSSTFSWWAGWLNDRKITIAPEGFCGYFGPNFNQRSKKFTY